MPPTQKEWQDLLVYLSKLDDRLQRLAEWQEIYDDRSKWFTRSVFGALIVIILGNIVTFTLTVLAWAFMLLLGPASLARTLSVLLGGR